MSLNPTENIGFKADKVTYGDELAGAAELLSDQMDMSKLLLQHHFPDGHLHENAHVVLDVQSRLLHILDGPQLFAPVAEDELTGLEDETDE